MSETCIVLDVSGDFAHFRKPHTTSPAQTFGVPPRTTIAGMIAGMLGLGRDSYYDRFVGFLSVSISSRLRERARKPAAHNPVNRSPVHANRTF